jgi:glycosyltransferase involved in cell wall biosynthesis
MKKGKVDIIIPAYHAHETIEKTLCSIAIQTIVEDLQVIIVNDGDKFYKDAVDKFKKYFSIKEVVLKENSGPGKARQSGIEAGDGEFFTCIDADDTFAGTLALQTLRGCIQQNDVIKCVSSRFDQLTDNIRVQIPHTNDMVWMFGKIYRREWIEQNHIYMNDTRANEDTGFNTWVRLLCDNPNEQVVFVNDLTYYWHMKENSITRINDGQYGFDQCMCGWTDNMIWAIQNAKKSRPFSGAVIQQIATVMINLYFYHIETHARKPVFEKQNWEYTKKFYNTLYKKIEDDITDDVLSQLYSMAMMQKSQSGDLVGIIPYIGIKEFFDKLRTEAYNPDDIYSVWEEMPKELIENNIKCGVCKEGYTNRPGHIVELPQEVVQNK